MTWQRLVASSIPKLVCGAQRRGAHLELCALPHLERQLRQLGHLSVLRHARQLIRFLSHLCDDVRGKFTTAQHRASEVRVACLPALPLRQSPTCGQPVRWDQRAGGQCLALFAAAQERGARADSRPGAPPLNTHASRPHALCSSSYPYASPKRLSVCRSVDPFVPTANGDPLPSQISWC